MTTVHDTMAAAPMPQDSTKKLAAGLVKKTTAYNADPTRICLREGWNNRFDLGDIESLSVGIATTLARQPDRPYATDMEVKRLLPSDPRATSYDFEVVTGHRRYEATQLLLKRGVTFPMGVNVRIVDRAQSDLESTILLFNENNQKPLLPLEEAAAYKRLRDGGMTIAAICKAVGRTDVHVRETLDLLEADADVQEAVKSGAVSGSTAKVIVSVAKGDAAKQKELVAAAKTVKGAKGADAKKKAAELKAKIQAQRDAKAKAKGKAVKIRALTDEQLSGLGDKLTKHLLTLLKEAKLDVSMSQAALQEWAKADEKLAAAYVAGAVDALKVAAGLKIDLAI